MTLLDVPMLMGMPRVAVAPRLTIVEANAAQLAAYQRLRREVFVTEQGLFAGNDHDRLDDDPRTIVLVAVAGGAIGSGEVAVDGQVLGGVRIAPALEGRDIGWWTGSRLVVAPASRGRAGIGGALVREACLRAERAGALRFEATVQAQNETMFGQLGWHRFGETVIGGLDHVRMRWPISRIARLAEHSKAFLAELLEPYSDWSDSAPSSLGGAGFVGDDGAPVPETDVIAACDAILPALIDSDPEWAGWCAVLVNANDLAAMGARPLGLMNAIGARDAATARRVMNGLRAGSQAWGIPVLGGHTQLGVSSALSVTALGRTDAPVPGGGGRQGQALSLTIDTGGIWRRGFEGAQWDSSSTRSSADLRALCEAVAVARPAAAKDVSMAGIVGTVGMLAESSGCGAVLEVGSIPSPKDLAFGDWLSCFPGFGMITADAAGASRMPATVADIADVESGEIGRLTIVRGVQLAWPDGVVTEGIPGSVTGLERA